MADWFAFLIILGTVTETVLASVPVFASHLLAIAVIFHNHVFISLFEYRFEFLFLLLRLALAHLRLEGGVLAVQAQTLILTGFLLFETGAVGLGATAHAAVAAAGGWR